MHKSNGLAKTWHTRKTTFWLRCVFVTVVFVSRLCGARSVQCFSVVVEMIVHVFLSSLVTVNVRRRWTSRRRTERTFAIRGVTIWGVSGFLVWENGHVWPMQSDVLAMRRCAWS